MPAMERTGHMLERVFAASILALATPVLLVAMLAVWLGDGAAPIYRAPRVGLGGRDFHMLKLRTMRPGADRLGGRFAPLGDPRITRIGAWLRRWKIDELPQLWNVLRGEMHLVGPRPDMREGVVLYAAEERQLLTVRPGMTDFASLWFVDEARLLAASDDPAAFYVAEIRPVKSRLGLLYVAYRAPLTDLGVLCLTATALISPAWARSQLLRMLARLDRQTASLSGVLGAVRG